MIPKFRHKKQFLGHNGAVFCLVKAAEKGFYSCGSDGMLVHWTSVDKEDGTLVARINTSVYALLYHAERDIFLTGNLNGNLQWIEDGKEQFNFKAHTKGVFALQNLGDRFLSLGGDGRLGVWNWENPRSPFFVTVSKEALRTIAVDTKNNRIIIGSSDGNIYVLDSSTLDVLHSFENAHANSVFSVCISSDSQFLYSGARDNFIKCWSMNDFSLQHVVPAHAATINHIIEGPADTLISASRDKELRIWNRKNLSLIQVLKAPRDQGHINSVNRLLWDRTNDLLYSTGDDKTIICWEID